MTLFDLVPASPLATDEARAELRTGRILCAACQRSGELFEAAMGGWRDSIRKLGKTEAMAHAEAAERAQAIADLRAESCQVWCGAEETAGGQTFDIGESTIRTTLEPFPVADECAGHHRPYDRAQVSAELADDAAFHARQKRAGKRRNKNWRGDSNAEAWDRARAGK